MLIFIKEQHLYFSWLRILGIQLCFWTSLVHVEHCSMIPLSSLCYTLSWSWHQNVVNLGQFGSKWDSCFFCFHMFIVMILLVCFFNNITQDIHEHFGGNGGRRSKYWMFWFQATLMVIGLLQRAAKPGYTPLSNGKAQESAKVRVFW